jgi:hypothetical protein
MPVVDEHAGMSALEEQGRLTRLLESYLEKGKQLRSDDADGMAAFRSARERNCSSNTSRGQAPLPGAVLGLRIALQRPERYPPPASTTLVARRARSPPT